MSEATPQPVSSTSKWLWFCALAVTLYVYRGAYELAFNSPYRICDFFQEWASARNYFEDLPIYTPQAESAWRYFQYRHDPDRGIFVEINGHPPTCVLLALPLGRIDYATALYLWNGAALAAALASVYLVLRCELGTARTWCWLPMLTLLFSNSFAQHVIMGQITLFLVVLLVGMAAADRQERPLLAGLLLGTATALKLFPGLFVLYFILVGKWRTVAAAVVAAAAWFGASAAVLGVQAYVDYVQTSLPEVLRYRDLWLNYSISGQWYKLFHAAGEYSIPWIADDRIAQIGSLTSNALVVATALFATYRSRGRPEAERSSLALMFTVAVLASPIAWDHYFLLLMWPLTRLVVQRPNILKAATIPLRISLFVLWINPLVFYVYATGKLRPPTPTETLCITSWPFYALLVVYVVGVARVLQDAACPALKAAESGSAASFSEKMTSVAAG